MVNPVGSLLLISGLGTPRVRPPGARPGACARPGLRAGGLPAVIKCLLMGCFKAAACNPVNCTATPGPPGTEELWILQLGREPQ